METSPTLRIAGLAATVAAGALLLAAALMGLSALGPGPSVGAVLLLVGALAGAPVVGLLGWRAVASGRRAVQAEPAALLGALTEAAAILRADGAIVSANAGWRDLVGPRGRLAAGALSGAFAALRQAFLAGRAESTVSVGGQAMRLAAAKLDDKRLLARLLPLEADHAQSAAEVQPGEPSPPAGSPRLDAFASASPFGAALIEGPDPFAGKILEVNPAWAAAAGDPSGADATLGDLLTPASRGEAASQLAAGGVGPFEVTTAARPDGIALLYLAPGDGRSVAFLVDVTEQKQMQTQLAQSNKMQAIGQLAGGVAHDFNNLLSAIQLRLDELLLRHPLGDPSYEGLSEIRQTSIRAADLVRQLLTFSRKATIQRETLDLGELISNFEVLLRRLIREDVRLETDYGRNLPLVRADKAQLENAVMNLVVNARDAVRSQGGGSVRLRTARVSQAEAFALGYGGQPMGEMAMIEVADDGPGIPPEVMAKIFDPFFTTKPVGEGTGLGLATVYGIVKQSEGWITVDSKPGQGAAFRIFLPVYEPPVLVEPPAPEPPRGRTTARDLSGAGRILFVEDEDAVRGVAARLLRARGYEVLEAADGEEALAIAEANAGEIDLMISDVIMPGIDGPTLLKQARGYLGSAPVMFISGYAEAEFSDLLEGEKGVSFLPKPIDIKALAERVKQQLQAA
jgi:two-component system cell cycle sensor histidine kinase/response regulator CckA